MPDRLISEAVEAILTERGQAFKGNHRYCRCVWIVYEILRYVHEGWIFYEERKGRNESGTENRAEITLKVSTISFAIDKNIFEFNRIETIVAREEVVEFWKIVFKMIEDRKILEVFLGRLMESGWINWECIIDNLWLLYIPFSKLKYFSEGILVHFLSFLETLNNHPSLYIYNFSYNW